MPKPFRYIEPVFFAGLFDDPLLLIFIRPLGRSLLFDCGQLHHLAKRVLKSLDAVFVSHAHMDHFMGMDTLVRHRHVSPRTTEIFGPAGISRRMEAKLSSYDWNLADTSWGDLRVGEVQGDTVTCTLFRGPEGFARNPEGCRLGPLYDNDYLTVEAATCDHKIAVLAYRITEKEAFALDEERMRREEVAKGAWITELERLFHCGKMSGATLTYLKREGERIFEAHTDDVPALYHRIRREHPPASIGYVTDAAFTRENLERIEALMNGVTLLVCECAFLGSEKEKARATGHFCTGDLNELFRRLKPQFALPMHLSKGYLGESGRLYQELSPPPGVTILKIPDRLTPRPLMSCEVPPLFARDPLR